MFNKNKVDEHNAWISFSDLYSGLMVIFVVVALALAGKYKVDADKFTKLNEITRSFEKLDSSRYFSYNEKEDRIELKTEINFEENSPIIPKVNSAELIKAGKELKKIIKSIVENGNVKILTVIEGRTSVDNKFDNVTYNELSFNRAVSLARLWEAENIKLDVHKNASLQVAGSGAGGKGRYKGKNEKKNRRFIIHIIPYFTNK